MNNQWFKPAVLPAADEHITGNYRHLVGACIGEESFTHRMYREVNASHFPPNLSAEAYVMDAIWLCNDQEIAPTRSNLIQLLALKHDINQVIETIDLCLKEAGEEPINRSAVRECSARIHIWLDDAKLDVASNKIAEIRDSPFAEATFKYDEMLKALTEASPHQNVIEQYSEKQLFDQWLRRQHQGYDEVQAGMEPGLQLPWLASQAFISRMKWGEFSMLMGPEGTGKTTLGLRIAEHWSWKQKLKCDTVLILCETQPDVMQTRWFANKSLIPFKALDSFEVDLRSERWLPKVEAFRAFQNRNSELYGHIHFLWMPEARVEQVVMMMERCARVSAANGRRVAFVIDYLQAFDWWSYREEQRIVLEMIGMRLAGANRRLKSHTLLLAQEGSTQGEAFGSHIPRKISQLVFLIRREDFGEERAQMDSAPVKDNGVPQKDALGNPSNI